MKATTYRGFGAVLVATAILGGTPGAGTAGPPELAETVEVRVQLRGTQGSVVSIPSGISCRPYCEAVFRRDMDVVLVAGSRRSSHFDRWEGACVGRSVSCALVSDRDTTVTARFAPGPTENVSSAIPKSYWLYVTLSGRGTIRSSPSGIACPPDCKKSFRKGKPVTLEAVPASGFEPDLSSHYANCAGASCKVTMNSTADVLAKFRKVR